MDDVRRVGDASEMEISELTKNFFRGSVVE